MREPPRTTDLAMLILAAVADLAIALAATLAGTLALGDTLAHALAVSPLACLDFCSIKLVHEQTVILGPDQLTGAAATKARVQLRHSRRKARRRRRRRRG